MWNSVLVVDDDPTVAAIVSLWLGAAGYEVFSCDDGARFPEVLARTNPTVCLLDVHLGEASGLTLLAHARAANPDMPVLMLTRDATIGVVVDAMRRGARDYLVKPVQRDDLVAAVGAAVDARRCLGGPPLSSEANEPLARLVGTSASMVALGNRILSVGRSDVTLLLQGETGAGKELVAQAVHRASARAAGPFVALNCAAIPESLQDSELFGHERGAFTGAHARRVGRFEQADGGTLFLDEVAELTPALQPRLLRVLEERTFHRVGGATELRTDVRIIAATHRDLREEVRQRRFRADLFYRLSVFELRVPPLRDRKEDIPALAQQFAAEFARRNGRAPSTFTPAALAALAAHDWPGNVRELKNAAEYAAVLATGPRFDVDVLPPSVFGAADAAPVAREAAQTSEREALVQAIADADGNASEAIRRLGMPRSTFYRRLRQYGLT
jgi:DNA-binding NtrC family response regulator